MRKGESEAGSKGGRQQDREQRRKAEREDGCPGGVAAVRADGHPRYQPIPSSCHQQIMPRDPTRRDKPKSENREPLLGG